MSALVDAGPLVALLDTSDHDHSPCAKALQKLSGSLFTTWVVFGEAMYLLRRGGWPAQAALWRLLQSEALVIADLDSQTRARAASLMEKYRNIPMSLGDATIVALAEAIEIKQIFTLDEDFEVYRYRDRHRFELVPANA
jgi:predicted nucleic acid-binding protein